MTACMASLRADCAQQIWMAFYDGTKELVDTESATDIITWICAKHLTLFPIISLSLNWGDKDLTEGPLGG